MTRRRPNSTHLLNAGGLAPDSRSRASGSTNPRVHFCRTGSAYALVTSQEIFDCAVVGRTVRARSKRRSGWQSMAPPVPMTTIPNRPETANRTKTTGTVSNSPRKYAAGRNTTKNCAPPISRWRSPAHGVPSAAVIPAERIGHPALGRQLCGPTGQRWRVDRPRGGALFTTV